LIFLLCFDVTKSYPMCSKLFGKTNYAWNITVTMAESSLLQVQVSFLSLVQNLNDRS